MDRMMLAAEILKIAKSLVSIEFPTQDAMDKYLKDHPDADRSNHRVVETKKQAPANKEAPAKRRPVNPTPQSIKEHVTFVQDGLDTEDSLGFFSWHDFEDDDKPNYGINEKEAEQHIKAVKPKVEAILKKHGVKGTVKIERGDGNVGLIIDKPRKDGKNLEDDDAVLDELEKVAPWEKN